MTSTGRNDRGRTTGGTPEPVSRFRTETERYVVVSAIENGAHRLGYFTRIEVDDCLPGWAYVVVLGRRQGFDTDPKRLLDLT